MGRFMPSVWQHASLGHQCFDIPMAKNGSHKPAHGAKDPKIGTPEDCGVTAQLLMGSCMRRYG